MNYKALQLNRYPGVSKHLPLFFFQEKDILLFRKIVIIKNEGKMFGKNFATFFLNTVLLFILMDTSDLFVYSTLTAY